MRHCSSCVNVFEKPDEDLMKTYKFLTHLNVNLLHKWPGTTSQKEQHNILTLLWQEFHNEVQSEIAEEQRE